MNIRFYNARILTMEERDGQLREIFLGEVWVKDDKIFHVGRGAEGQSGEERVPALSLQERGEGPGGTEAGGPGEPILWDREIDCRGNLLMPGFKDAHTHSGMTLLRSFADDMPLHDWLTKQIFPVEAKMTGEDIYELSRLAVLEYLTSGITAVFDMYLTPETIAEAFDNMGMRCVQVAASQSAAQTQERYLKLNGKSPLQSFMLGFHAEYTSSRELLEAIADLARQYKAPVFTHLSETRQEVEGCKERYGMTPVAFLDSLGMFDYGGGGYHCVHVTPEEIAIMKEKGLYAVTNPGSNAKLASGIAPINDFLRAGVKVAVGTDGPASNNCLDMFREMFLVTGLARLREMDASAVDAREVLKMATVNGSHAMGLPDTDVLAPGKAADMILIDLNQPNMQPLNNIAKNLVYSGSKQNVVMTMINGAILYEKGNFHTGTAPEEIYEKAERIRKRLIGPGTV